jgi:hypothetical protein
MSSAAPTSAPARPVQKFKATTGHVIGWLGLAACAAVVAVVLTSELHVVGVRVALGAVLVAVLIQVALLRPSASAYDETLVLRGMISDTTLPLAGIDAAVVRHMLVVWVGDDRYTCSSIARSTRSMVKRRRPGVMSVLGLQQVDDRMGAVGASGDLGGVGDYATFVETRIEDLARSARRDGKSAPPVQRRWAWVEIAALGASALAFVLSLVVL